MSEPIKLWDKFGIAHTFFSPSIVAGLLAQGYTKEPPAAKIIATWNPPATEPTTFTVAQPPALTPNDTQEVATVKPPKRKREKGDGVL